MNNNPNEEELRKFLKVSGFTLNASVAMEWWELTNGPRLLRVTIEEDDISVYRTESHQLQYQIVDLNPNSVPISLIKSIIRKAMIL